MDNAEIAHCRRCIAIEEKLGNQAPSPEAGDKHYQMAMLYRAQLAVLERPRVRVIVQPWAAYGREVRAA